MQKIQTQEALAALKNGEILLTRQTDQVQFYALVNGRVRIQNSNSRFTLSIEEWQALFFKEEFWLYEPVETSEISLEKDAEYYGWNHKSFNFQSNSSTQELVITKCPIEHAAGNHPALLRCVESPSCPVGRTFWQIQKNAPLKQAQRKWSIKTASRPLETKWIVSGGLFSSSLSPAALLFKA